MTKTDDAERLPTRVAALGVLVDAHGPAALADLLAAVDHRDPEYRKAALLFAEKLRAPTAVRQWTAKADKVDAERRAEIILMLGRQGDKASAAFIRGALAAKEPVVAMAAAESLAHMERGAANADLLALLKRSSGEQAKQVGDILLWTTDEARLEPIAAALDALSPSAKAAAVRVIGAKSGRRYAARVFALTSDSNPEVRTAAIGALAGVAGASDLPALLRLLETTNEAGLVDEVQKGVVASARQMTPADAGAKALVDAMKTSGAPGADHRSPAAGGRAAGARRSRRAVQRARHQGHGVPRPRRVAGARGVRPAPRHLRGRRAGLPRPGVQRLRPPGVVVIAAGRAARAAGPQGAGRGDHRARAARRWSGRWAA